MAWSLMMGSPLAKWSMMAAKTSGLSTAQASASALVTVMKSDPRKMPGWRWGGWGRWGAEGMRGVSCGERLRARWFPSNAWCSNARRAVGRGGGGGAKPVFEAVPGPRACQVHQGAPGRAGMQGLESWGQEQVLQGGGRCTAEAGAPAVAGCGRCCCPPVMPSIRKSRLASGDTMPALALSKLTLPLCGGAASGAPALGEGAGGAGDTGGRGRRAGAGRSWPAQRGPGTADLGLQAPTARSQCPGPPP
jgi:hypothetical protein